MESEPSTSHETNSSELPVTIRWTRDLHGIPAFTYELLIKHVGTENSGIGAQKHYPGSRGLFLLFSLRRAEEK